MDLWPTNRRLDEILANQGEMLRWLRAIYKKEIDIMATAKEMQDAQVQLFADIDKWRADDAAQIAALKAIVPTADTAATQAAIDAVTAALVAKDQDFHPAVVAAAAVIGPSVVVAPPAQ